MSEESQEIARQREFEATGEGEPAHDSDRHSRTSLPMLQLGPCARTTSTRMTLSLAACTASRSRTAHCLSTRLKGGLASTMLPIPSRRSNGVHNSSF